MSVFKEYTIDIIQRKGNSFIETSCPLSLFASLYSLGINCSILTSLGINVMPLEVT